MTNENEPLFNITKLNASGDFVYDESGKAIASAGVSYAPSMNVNHEVLYFVTKLEALPLGEVAKLLSECKAEEEAAKQVYMLKQLLTRLADSTLTRRVYAVSKRGQRLRVSLNGVKPNGKVNAKHKALPKDSLEKLVEQFAKAGITPAMLKGVIK